MTPLKVKVPLVGPTWRSFTSGKVCVYYWGGGGSLVVLRFPPNGV